MLPRKILSCPFLVNHLLSLPALGKTDLISVSIVLLSTESLINGIIQYIILYVWFLSLSIMLSRFFHDPVCNSIYINVNKHILCWTDLILLTSSVLINSSWVLTTVYRGVVCSFLLLNDISLYQRSTFCLSVHQSEDIWVVSILDYYKQCCFEQHTHTGVCVDISCHFFWF